MSSKSERERLIIIGSGSPLAKHSMNQGATKRSLEGERRLGITEERTQSEFSQAIEDLKSDELFMFFCNAAASYDREGLPVPARVGLFALGISSLINAKLKEDPQAFIEEVRGAQQFTYDSGSPLGRLIPEMKMVANFIRRPEIQFKREDLYLTLKGAGVFVYNFGALNFGQGEEVAALHALMGINNISVYLASEINEQNLSVKHARLMTVAFGETTNRHLRALKPKKNFQAKKRR